MLGYCTIGVSEPERALAFYDALIAEIGGRRIFGNQDRIWFYGADAPPSPMLALCIPYNQEAQHPGNGNMVALPGGSPAEVDRLYAKAIELGATDEGPPGYRVPNVFYGAYVRDLDGNKLCFFDMNMG